MQVLLPLILCFFLASCSGLKALFQVRKNPFDLSDYRPLVEADFTAHLERLGAFYLEGPDVQFVTLSKAQESYLERIFDSILSNNELLLGTKLRPKFYVVNNPSPFHFSLPNARFILSTGLILKYLKSEGLLVSVLAFETIRCIRQIYRQGTVVPTGHMTAERLLLLMQIDLKTKNEMNKWSFYVMKRAGHDPFTYLSWLQIQNKNILDFGLLNYDASDIVKEEYSFKNFIVSEGQGWRDSGINEENSSKDYYAFIQGIKRQGV